MKAARTDPPTAVAGGEDRRSVARRGQESEAPAHTLETVWELPGNLRSLDVERVPKRVLVSSSQRRQQRSGESHELRSTALQEPTLPKWAAAC